MREFENLAGSVHLFQKYGDGRPHMEHVREVVAHTKKYWPQWEKLAWVHDVLEDVTDGQFDSVHKWLLDRLDDTELQALYLLTRSESDTYNQYIEKICAAKGWAGRMARAVKKADLYCKLGNNPEERLYRRYVWAVKQIDRAMSAHATKNPEESS